MKLLALALLAVSSFSALAAAPSTINCKLTVKNYREHLDEPKIEKDYTLTLSDNGYSTAQGRIVDADTLAVYGKKVQIAGVQLSDSETLITLHFIDLDTEDSHQSAQSMNSVAIGARSGNDVIRMSCAL